MRVGPIPARGRLLKRQDFLQAARGRRFHTGRVTAQGRRREADDGTASGLRIGFTLTRKVGHATERNRIRRRLRAAAAEAAGRHLAEPVDVVLIGRREALSAPFPLLLEDLARALEAVTRSGSGRDARGRSST
ncbi:ribonuclease P protein component [Enterovirga sp.]|uniref:ribonuclease P protein component n=1 Tax=Enterovirga sp. TaxID=2026350 RepID=UPI0026359811|nr:ribonuclease P protein component [Enterovirga sp.]